MSVTIENSFRCKNFSKWQKVSGTYWGKLFVMCSLTVTQNFVKRLYGFKKLHFRSCLTRNTLNCINEFTCFNCVCVFVDIIYIYFLGFALLWLAKEDAILSRFVQWCDKFFLLLETITCWKNNCIVFTDYFCNILLFCESLYELKLAVNLVGSTVKKIVLQYCIVKCIPRK